MKNRIWAISLATPAIPVNPSKPAMMAMTKNVTIHPNMAFTSLVMLKKRVNGNGGKVTENQGSFTFPLTLKFQVDNFLNFSPVVKRICKVIPGVREKLEFQRVV